MFGDSAILSLLWALLCVVVIIGLAYWFTKFVVGQRLHGLPGAARGTARIEVLARMAVGKDQGLLLVQVGERYLLVGAAPGGLTSLAEFTPEEAAAWAAEAEEAPQTMSFSKALQSVLEQRKRR